jgi:hypothetical protein
MALSEPFPSALRRTARRAYEWGRARGALVRGSAATLLAIPALFLCDQTGWAAVCAAGFGLVVAAGRFRGGPYERGSRAGALAGILPCLLPAVVRAADPNLCVLLGSQGPWICAAGGIAAGIVLGLRAREAQGASYWGSALAALGCAGALGCMPAGLFGFVGLGAGMVAGGAPVLAARRVFA